VRLEPPTRVYLAGPMRGRPAFNADAFERAREDLRTVGFEVWCPAEQDVVHGFDPRDPDAVVPTLGECMDRDIPALVECDAVVLLPGWRVSEGCAIEAAVARHHGIPLYEYPELMPVETILSEAERITRSARQEDYGHPLDNLGRTARLWTAYLGDHCALSPEDVAHMMVLFKLAREMHAHTRDNLVDMCGYVDAAQRIREERARRRLACFDPFEGAPCE